MLSHSNSSSKRNKSLCRWKSFKRISQSNPMAKNSFQESSSLRSSRDRFSWRKRRFDAISICFRRRFSLRRTSIRSRSENESCRQIPSFFSSSEKFRSEKTKFEKMKNQSQSVVGLALQSFKRDVGRWPEIVEQTDRVSFRRTDRTEKKNEPEVFTLEPLRLFSGVETDFSDDVGWSGGWVVITGGAVADSRISFASRSR